MPGYRFKIQCLSPCRNLKNRKMETLLAIIMWCFTAGNVYEVLDPPADVGPGGKEMMQNEVSANFYEL